MAADSFAPASVREVKGLVSVLVPAYNQGAYLADALDSLIGQTYAEWEAIVVDDGSPDNVAEVAEAYALRDARIKFFHTENGGVSAARNFAASKASGEFVLALDADDVIAPEYFARCVERFRQEPATDVVYCRWRYFGAEEGSPELSYSDYESLLLVNRIFVTAMVRREAFLQVGGFDVNMRRGLEDWEFWIRFLSPESVVYQIPEELFFYRIKESSKNREAHDGLVPFDTQLYMLEKHKALYNKYFGSPILAIARERFIAERYRRKYDRVFYRRIWRSLKGLLRRGR